jgi:RNA polymerase sigma-70 factor (ECF subfamily)
MPHGRPLRSNEADEKLLIEAAQRDPNQFGELYELHFERVYAYVVRRIRDRFEAQDLTSEVFHQALANLGHYEFRGIPFAAWLFRIAANAIADRGNRLAKEHNVPARELADDTDLEEIEQRAQVFRFVLDLPADQRRVLEMRFVDEKSIREIALELDRSEGAIKQLQFRGIEGLRARMGEQNG